MIRKSQFDPNAAFKNIVGILEGSEQPENESSRFETTKGEKETMDILIITGPQEKEEIRNKRVNLVVKPSVHQLAKAKCERLNISLNECINQFLEKWSKES